MIVRKHKPWPQVQTMLEDRRRSTRHALDVEATLQTEAGLALGGCRLMDISEGGARLLLERAQVPDEFLLVTEGAESLNCRVVWRLDSEIGVEFVDLAETD